MKATYSYPVYCKSTDGLIGSRRVTETVSSVEEAVAKGSQEYLLVAIDGRPMRDIFPATAAAQVEDDGIPF